VGVPAVQREHRHAVPRRVDEPASADVDAGVTHLGRNRLRPAITEEEDVAGHKAPDGDPLRAPDLSAHLVRGAAAERARKLWRARVSGELVDAPDEAGAVETAPGRDAERRLRTLG